MDKVRADDSVREVTDHLADEFAGVLRRADVAATVREACRDLDGQIVPAALTEMLHRLARYRLASRIPMRRPTGPFRQLFVS